MTLKSAGGERDYSKAINAAIRGLWIGEFDQYTFIDTMVGTVQRGLTRAWHEGIATCGLFPGDMTVEELFTLENLINGEISHIYGLSQAVEQGSRANGGKLTPLLKRAKMWSNRYNAVLYQAQTTSCADLKLKWVWNPLKEHCASCKRLNGKVYRASIWRKYDLYPRHRRLA